MSERIRSKHVIEGLVSTRSYTKTELAAAKRLGFANNTKEPSGAIFWASGDWVPEQIQKALEDYKILAVAIEREWPNLGTQEEHQ